MKTRYCNDCSHMTERPLGGEFHCIKGHKPRFYPQKSLNPYERDWGWKRKCEDYEEKQK